MDGIDPRRTRRRISRAVAGFGSGALSSWANQSLDNSGQPIFQAITDINWAKVGLDGGMSMLSGKLGAATGVIGRNLCTSGKACSFLIESVMEAVDSGGTQLVENVLDGDSSTGVFDNVAQACLMGAVFGGVQGGLKPLKAHSPDTGNSGGNKNSSPANSVPNPIHPHQPQKVLRVPTPTSEVSGKTRLWRAVESEELNDVFSFGHYGSYPNSIFKRFAFNEADLDKFIDVQPNRKYTKTYIDIPDSWLSVMDRHDDPGGTNKAIGIDVTEYPDFYKAFDRLVVLE